MQPLPLLLRLLDRPLLLLKGLTEETALLAAALSVSLDRGDAALEFRLRFCIALLSVEGGLNFVVIWN